MESVRESREDRSNVRTVVFVLVYPTVAFWSIDYELVITKACIYKGNDERASQSCPCGVDIRSSSSS